MFSGITQGLFKVISVVNKPGLMDYTVQLTAELCSNLKPGDSVAVDGICQTVVSINGISVAFQAINETLDKTTLITLKTDSMVSIERSIRYGDEIGGHEVCGHVFGTAVIQQIISSANNVCLIVQSNPQWMKYILPKGFIAVDGSSLTVGETFPEQGIFHLHLIPETLKLTNFANKQVGDKVNIEFDHKTKTIVDTVERVLNNKGG